MFTNLLGVGIIFPFLPYFAERLGANTFTIGLLAITYPLCSLIASPFLGSMSDRFGRRPILLLSLVGTIIGFILLGYAKTLPVLFLARIVDGLSAGNTPTAFAYVADISKGVKRTTAISFVSSSFWIGSALGFALGGVLTGFNYSLPGYVAASIACLGFILTVLFLPETAKKIVTKKHQFILTRSIHTFFRHASGIYVGLISLVFIKEIIWWSLDSTLALFAKHVFLLTPLFTGLLFTYFGLIGVCMQLLGLKILLTLCKEWSLTAYCLIIVGIGLFFTANATSIPILLLGGTLCAMGSSIVNPVLTSLISKSSTQEQHGTSMGIMNTADSLGTLLGPIIALSLMGIYDRLPYLVGGILAVSSGVFSFLLFAKQKKLMKKYNT